MARGFESDSGSGATVALGFSDSGTDRVPAELAADRIDLAHRIGTGLVRATGVAVGFAAVAVRAVALVTGIIAAAVIGAVAPDREELAEVDAVHEAVVVQVLRTAGAGTPRGEEESEVRPVDDAVVVEVARAGGRAAAAGSTSSASASSVPYGG